MIEKSSSLIDPKQTYEFVEDFDGGTTTSGSIGSRGWTSTLTGTGAITQSAIGYGTHAPGGISVETGTGQSASVGNARLQLGANILSGGGGLATSDRLGIDMRMSVETLSAAGTNEFIARFGWWDAANTGIFFEYDRLTSVNWRCRTGDGTLATFTSSTAVATGMKKYSIRATAGSARFLIDDVTVALTTNRVPGLSNFAIPMMQIVCSTNTTPVTRRLHCDYYAMRFAYGSVRS